MIRGFSSTEAFYTRESDPVSPTLVSICAVFFVLLLCSGCESQNSQYAALAVQLKDATPQKRQAVFGKATDSELTGIIRRGFASQLPSEILNVVSINAALYRFESGNRKLGVELEPFVLPHLLKIGVWQLTAEYFGSLKSAQPGYVQGVSLIMTERLKLFEGLDNQSVEYLNWDCDMVSMAELFVKMRASTHALEASLGKEIAQNLAPHRRELLRLAHTCSSRYPDLFSAKDLMGL